MEVHEFGFGIGIGFKFGVTMSTSQFHDTNFTTQALTYSADSVEARHVVTHPIPRVYPSEITVNIRPSLGKGLG